MDKILIIDDSVPFLTDVETLLKKNFEVLTANNGKKGLNILRKERVSAVLLDLKLPDINGIDVLKKIKEEIDPLLPVIIITDFGDIPTAVKAIHLGAKDFIQKDFNRELLSRKIIDALEKRELELSIIALKSSVEDSYDKFIFSSENMKSVDVEMSRQAMHNEHILLVGETGVGKDLIAYEIHKRSRRKDKLFIQVPLQSYNSSLIESELFGYEKGAFSGAEKTKIGKFEAANGGTLYFPEISDITESMQLKLLQFFQYKEISRVGQEGGKKIKLDVKIILATNKDPQRLLSEGKFREDFYYRISAIVLKIPSLSSRSEDIKSLTDYFLSKYSTQYNKQYLTIESCVYDMFKNYGWKGNVRELENAVRNAVIYSEDNGIITKEFFPFLRDDEERIDNKSGYKLAEQKFRKDYFTNLLNQTKGNKTKAAELTGISRQGLDKILKGLNLE